MSLKKSLALASVTALALGALATGASAGAFAPAHGNDEQSRSAGPVFVIDELGTDAMGGDSWFNRNREFVKIRNASDSDQTITDFRVEDIWAHALPGTQRCNNFTFTSARVPAAMRGAGDAVVLPAGHTVTVFNGRGSASTTSTNHVVYDNSPKYCGANGHVFNNDGEVIHFVNPAGADQATATYQRKGGYEVTF